MKIALFCSLPIILALLALEAFAQGTCPNGGGGAVGPVVDHVRGPVVGLLPQASSPQDLAPLPESSAPRITVIQLPAASVIPAAVPAAPAARITVLPADAPTATASAMPKLRLTIVDDVVPVVPAKTQVAAATNPEPTPPVEPAPSVEPAKPEAIDDAIAGLVGKWKAVARHSNGTLTTVELQLDSRGWAELTVPDKTGTPSTIKSRVKYEDQELKLESGDAVTLLGKLVTFNQRQMVLERAEGKVTFVRV